jgi:hypothetical protein
LVGLIELADAIPARTAPLFGLRCFNVPCIDFPDAVGGTEVYGAGLTEALRPLPASPVRLPRPGEVEPPPLPNI